MSLNGDFDVVLEATESGLATLLRVGLRTALGGPAPWELSFDAGIGTASLIVDDIDIVPTIADDQTVTVSVAIGRASVVTPLAPICPASGTLTVSGVRPRLVSPSASRRQLEFDFTPATIVFSNLKPASLALLASDLSAVVGPLITAQLGKVLAPLVVSLVNGADGSLYPLVASGEPMLALMFDAGPAKRSLALFMNVLRSRAGMGNVAAKEPSTALAGNDVAVTVGVEAFDAQIFCPAAASTLGVALPPCGNGGPHDIGGGFRLTSIKAVFVQDAISVIGQVETSGTCYDAAGTLSTRLVPSIASATLTLDAESSSLSDVSIDVPWYCWLASVFIGGPIASAAIPIARSIGEGIVSGVVNGLIGSLPHTFSFGLPTLALGTKLTAVEISEAALAVGGLIADGGTRTQERVDIAGSVVNASRSLVGSGTFTSSFCVYGDVDYQEWSQEQTGTYAVVPQLMLPPFAIAWTLRSGGSVRSLAGSGTGQVTLPVFARYPLPAPAGTGVNRDATITYTINDDGSIVLRNEPADGCYSIDLTATVTDCSGHIQTAVTSPLFLGMVAEYGDDYLSKLLQCIEAFTRRLRDEHRILPRIDLRWLPVDHPTPERVGELLIAVAANQNTEIQAALAYLSLLHGAAFAGVVRGPGQGESR